MKLYLYKILSQLILKLEHSDFFQIEALGLKKANILEQRGAAAPLAPLLDTPLGVENRGEKPNSVNFLWV